VPWRFTWQPSSDSGSGLNHYRVLIDDSAVANVAAGTESYTPSSDLAAGSHTWQVKAIDGVGNARESATRSFTVISDPVANIAVSPTLALTGESVQFDASGSTAPAAGSITDYKWDLDGDGSFDRDTGSTPTTSKSYDEPATLSPRVKLTSSFDTTDTASASLEVRRAPPSGELGVTVNHGAQFTNDPDVTVSAVWPPYATTMLVSNDGGFLDPGSFPVNDDTPWTLDSSGSERLPKTIYVRFRGGESGPETYTDDIILDQTPPELESAAVVGGASAEQAKAAAPASARTYRLRIHASDNASGVRSMQITSNKDHPGHWRKFDATPSFSSSSSRIFVRVRDGAKNRSGWRRAR
jgi:hypothetical protein